MKKLLATIVALMLLVNLAACGSKEANVDDGADSNSFSKTETSVPEEQEEMDEIEEQETPEIAEVANTPKDISEVNPDDYWQGDDYFDLERFLADCGFSGFIWGEGEGYIDLYCTNGNFSLYIGSNNTSTPPATICTLTNLTTKDYYVSTCPADFNLGESTFDIVQVGSSPKYFMIKGAVLGLVSKIPLTDFNSLDDPWAPFTTDYVLHQDGHTVYR